MSGGAATVRRVRLPRRSSAAISPTAYYTGQVWVRHGLAPADLGTRPGVLLHHALQPAMLLSGLAGGPTLEGVLLARHRLIDALLVEAIESGQVTQVVELAAGVSARGLRFAERFGDRITYLETDLPAMADRKRDVLSRRGLLGTRHRVETVDALAADGPESLAALAGGLDRDAGLAVVTEGLLNYLPAPDVRLLWRRIAGVLAEFPDGRYLSDLHLAEENRHPLARAGVAVIGAFVRGRLHLHFPDAPTAEDELHAAGFGTATLHHPHPHVRVIEARP